MNNNQEFLNLVDKQCQKINELFKCQVVFLDHFNHCLNHMFISNMTPPYKQNAIDYLIDLFKDVQTQSSIIKSQEELYYIGIDLALNDNYYGKYIIGPFLDKIMNQEEVIRLYDKHCDMDLVMNYYRNMRVVSYETICIYASLCKSMIDDCFFNSEDDYYLQTSTDSEIQLIHNEEIFNQKEYVHKGYNTDKIMLECVKNGYPGEIKRFLKDYWMYTGRRELLEGTLRDRKDFTISYIAMLIQAAIEGGMDYEVASRLNLKYIHLVEKKNLSSELERLEIDILYDLSQKVKKIKRQGNTKLVRDCKDYIMENISLKLKVQDIADYFHIDSKYLARRFKNETNETIKNYIHRKKVEEAKRIMQSTNMSLIEIASALSFHDQSHFTKIFKEFAGITPKQYYKKIKSN